MDQVAGVVPDLLAQALQLLQRRALVARPAALLPPLDDEP
jgi:hypothetical protein